MTVTEVLTTLKQQLFADKKKAAVLGGLSCVLAVVIFRQFMSGSDNAVPAPALAATPAVARPNDHVRPAPASPRPSSGTHRLEPGATQVAGSVEKWTVTRDDAGRRTVSTEGMSRRLHRDLFAVNWPMFPLSRDDSSTDGGSSKQTKFWGKVVSAALEYKKIRREETSTLAKELAELKLQSTLTGPSPMAYISGHLLRENETISGFSVQRIYERRVLLLKSGQVRELTMP